MGIGNKWFGRGQGEEPENPLAEAVSREGIPVGLNQDTPVLEITDLAKERIRAVLEAQEPPMTAIRVAAMGPGRYAMNLEPNGEPDLTDTVLPYAGFKVLVDAQSLTFVEGASLDYVEQFGGGGFKFSHPNDPNARVRKEAPEGPEGEIWRQIQQILEEEINPAVAGHGGFIDLIDVQGNTVFVKMGGGCQGCGMANVTLKQGVETVLRSHLPHIEEVLDTTDHAGGRNPYYAPTTK